MRMHEPGPLAAIDLGSNSFRLEIAQFAGDGGGYQRLAYHKDIVRLGDGLGGDGLLSTAAIQRGLAALARLAAPLRQHGLGPGRVRAVATQTLRAARNRDDFLQPAQQLLGCPVEVISGDEEARLIYAGVACLQPGDAQRLVIDIGGGSTELAIGRGHAVLRTVSFAVGCIGLSKQHFDGGHITASGLQAAQQAAAAGFAPLLLQPFGREHWQEALAASGTAGTVSQMLQAAQVTDGSITPQALAWCAERCLQAGHVDALGLLGLEPKRRAVLPGGLAILTALVHLLGVPLLQPTKGALRQGVLVDLARQRQP